MKKNKKKEKILNILKSYKTIIYISFLINIILLLVTYHLIRNNNIYSFSGGDEYLNVTDGLIVLNSDLNILHGNNIKYNNNQDYDIKSYKIGYYVMEDKKLVSIVETSLQLDDTVKLSEIINNFTTFNLTEKSSKATYFTKEKRKLLDDGLYLILEARTTDDTTIFSNVKLNVSKISKY